MPGVIRNGATLQSHLVYMPGIMYSDLRMEAAKRGVTQKQVVIDALTQLDQHDGRLPAYDGETPYGARFFLRLAPSEWQTINQLGPNMNETIRRALALSAARRGEPWAKL